jgi:hypothetical protein
MQIYLSDNFLLVGGDCTEEWRVAISKTICGIILWLFQYMLESHGFKTYILLDKVASSSLTFCYVQKKASMTCETKLQTNQV